MLLPPFAPDDEAGEAEGADAENGGVGDGEGGTGCLPASDVGGVGHVARPESPFAGFADRGIRVGTTAKQDLSADVRDLIEVSRLKAGEADCPLEGVPPCPREKCQGQQSEPEGLPAVEGAGRKKHGRSRKLTAGRGIVSKWSCSKGGDENQ